MFKDMKSHDVKKGNFLAIFNKKESLLKYLYCILIGLPVWFMIGVPVSLSQDVFAKELEIEGIVNGTAVMFAYLGLSAGDLASGLLSQILRSRKKVVYLYLLLSLLLLIVFVFMLKGISAQAYYFVCFLVGFCSGYWAIFVSIAAEQFGTNIRSTVTNTVPNFVRGAVLPITMSFTALGAISGNLMSTLIVGLICLALAAFATFKVKETFAKDLNYFESL
jgi:hypothetical protein